MNEFTILTGHDMNTGWHELMSTEINYNKISEISLTAEDASTESCCNRSQPNILKKRNPPLNDLKTLQFSPSRFLNPNTTQRAASCISGDVTIASKIDDSGFDTSCEPDEIFCKAVTSTPIGKKSHKYIPSPLKDIKENVSPVAPRARLSETSISGGPETESSCHRQIASTFDSGNETVFKTPLIRRFLNESGPRTPTPFKCETTSSECCKHRGQLSHGVYSEPILHRSKTHSMPPAYGFQNYTEELMSTSKYGNGHHKSQKRARKALVLDMESSQSQKLSPKETFSVGVQSLSRKKPVGLIPLGYSTASKNIRIHGYSSLLDNKAIVHCRNLGTGRKSFCITPHDALKKLDEDVGACSLQLNKKWVAVACGHSEDQKAMTIAAKQYLKHR